MHMRNANQVPHCAPALRTEAICFVSQTFGVFTRLSIQLAYYFPLNVFFGGGKEGSHLWREAKTYATLKKTRDSP